MYNTIAALLTFFLLTLPAQAEPDYVRNAAEIVKNSDWASMQTIQVDIDEHEYDPTTIRFKAGQPYKLVMRNHGEKKHYFTAPEFFRSIAMRKIQSNKDGEIKAPYLLAVELMAEGGQLDLYFVPVQTGEYPVYCTIDKHREEGMEGWIVVE